MKLRLTVSYLIAAGLFTASSTALAGAADLNSCCTAGDKDFPKVGGNLGNQAYSALTQIDKANIHKLAPAWLNHVSAAPPATTDTGAQTTPIVVDGVIYLDTPNGDVIAVDGATGATKWKWHPVAFNPTGTRRGVSVGDGKVFTLASGNRIVALDKNTGAQVWVVQPVALAPETTFGNIQKVATVYHDGMVYVGTNDASRNAGLAVRSSDGAVVWSFYGGARPGTVYVDVNGNTVNAGDSWTTDVTPNDTPNTCALTAGVSTWIHPAIDPDLNMVYWAYGNVRSCGSSQDASGRPGQNLFSSSLVALDAKTGQYKWHFQSNHHGHWDMDNTHPPVLADVSIGGSVKKLVYYGSKSGETFVLDRSNGQPVLGVEERPVPRDSRQRSWPTQPYPVQPSWLVQCVVYQALGTEIPGDPNRAVPNYNGYQPDASGQLVYTSPNYLDADIPFVTYPPEYGATHRKGCLNDPHWDLPVLSTPSQNGGADWASHSFSQKLGLYYIPYGTNPTAHDRSEGGNGLRALGQYQTGGIVAIDGTTNLVRWRKEFGLDAAHGDGVLTTAADLLFIGLPDGHFLTLDAATGNELWRFQSGAAISSAPVTYSINGEQYVAIFSSGTGIPYGNSITEGDSLWAFKLGGTYKTASGSAEANTPSPLTIRRPVGGSAVEGSTVNNTVYLGRNSRTDVATARDSTSTSGMNPTFMRVPVGTTVTFLNPGAATLPNFPNVKMHCATQFFEGLFNPKLNPGESFQYTFNRAGEYFYNDCTDPRPTGKIVAYLTPQDVPGALRFEPGTLNFKSPSGYFTGVNGVVTALFDIPEGYTIDGDVKLKTPLSTTLFSPVSMNVNGNGRQLVAHFDKATIDNNIPEGSDVPLVLFATFISNGAQTQLTSTANVKVVK